MGRDREINGRLLSKAKRRQASKLSEIRRTLVAAGYNSAAKPAIALEVIRPAAWAILNRDKRVGASASIIKRILASPNLPPAARRKIEEYVEERVGGLYGHSEKSTRNFRGQFIAAEVRDPQRAIEQRYDH